MDREEVRTYVERSEDIIDEAPQMGETNTKEMLVRRFIRVLGWEFHPSEVKLEYPVRMASTRTKVDYALMLESAPVVFVEAKGLDTELTEDHREQITSYMHNEEGVDWGLLTNGAEYEFFMYDGTPSGFSLGAFGLEELPENTEVVGTLSKESVSSGESEERAERLRERRRAISTLRDEKDEIADDVTEAVTERVGESMTAIAETEAKEFVDRVVDELENGGGTTEDPKTEDEETVGDTEDGVVLTAGETVVASLNGDTQADTMANAVDFLIRERDLMDFVSIPYVPGDKKAILNTNPEHPDGEEMRGYRRVSGDCYLDTHASKNQKEKRLSQLAGMCGLDIEFNW
jgi:hypothetical protein